MPKFNAFDQVSPSIENSKQLLFPINFKKWCSLGFVSLMSGTMPGLGKINLPSPPNEKDAFSFDQLTGNFLGTFKDNPIYYFVLPVLFILSLLILFLTYITSIFQFVFLECLISRKVDIKMSYTKNKHLGFSLFLFQVIMGIVSLIIIAIPATSAVFLVYLHGWSFDAFTMHDYALFAIWILLSLFIILLLGTFYCLVRSFTIPHMYYNNSSFSHSFHVTFLEMSKCKSSIVKYLFARLLFSIIIGIASALVAGLLLILLIIIAIPIALLLYVLLAKASSLLIIIIVAPLALIALAFFIFAASVVLLPFTSFMTYFSLNSYQALMKTSSISRVSLKSKVVKSKNTKLK